MKATALILAAGRGERIRPLTDTTPKPLLVVRGKALIDWHVEALALGGFTQLVVNTAWLGEQLAVHLNSRFLNESGLRSMRFMPESLSISYSHEGVDFGDALETAGGIARVLPLLADVFWVVAGDVFMPGFRFDSTAVDAFARSDKLAHLWLVPNLNHVIAGLGACERTCPPSHGPPEQMHSIFSRLSGKRCVGCKAFAPSALSSFLCHLDIRRKKCHELLRVGTVFRIHSFHRPESETPHSGGVKLIFFM